MAEFFVVRHTEDSPKSEALRHIHGSIDTYLTPNGQQQAERVATRLAGHDIVAVYAPPLLRTLSTARAICRLAGGQLIIDDSLVGRDMGRFVLEGHKSMAPAATETISTAKGLDYYVQVPGAESLDAFYDRTQTVYKALSAQYADQAGSVVLVTQHLAGTLFRGAHDNLELIDTLEYGDLPHGGVARLTPGQLSAEL